MHDESTYYANCDQTYFWGDDETNVIKQKSLSSSLMVSDFVDETTGILRDDSSEARVFLETSKDGYFNNDMLLKQVKKKLLTSSRESTLRLRDFSYLIMHRPIVR